MKRGIYETTYGNAAYVSGRPSAKTVYDLDMGERVPIEAVDPAKWVRRAEPTEIDRQQALAKVRLEEIDKLSRPKT